MRDDSEESMVPADAIIGKMKASVCENAVNVERDETHFSEWVGGRLASHMMPARKRS